MAVATAQYMDSGRPALHFREINVQRQRAAAHMALVLHPCEVKVTDAGCVYRHVYAAASLPLKAQARTWF